MKNPWKREMISKTARQLITQTTITFYYFFFFLVLLPGLGLVENYLTDLGTMQKAGDFGDIYPKGRGMFFYKPFYVAPLTMNFLDGPETLTALIKRVSKEQGVDLSFLPSLAKKA